MRIFGPEFCAARAKVGDGMAAGRSKFNLDRRGAKSGRGANVPREGLAPLPSTEPFIPTIDSLEEIFGWLGTFRERLREARIEERPEVAAMVETLEAATP
jgi:hypothetical protein